MINQSKSYLYIPIETKVRELDAKLFLACIAANKGICSIIGHKSKVAQLIEYLPRGAFLNYSITNSEYNNIKKSVDYGHLAFALDEEGLVFRNNEEYLNRKISTKSYNLLKGFFCYGKVQKNCINQLLKEDEKIYLTGNPRIDIIRPELKKYFCNDTNDIKKTYGNIILFNTRFGTYNHHIGYEYNLNQYRKMEYWNDIEEEKFTRLLQFEEKLFKHFVEIIVATSEIYSDYKIIVRPHPSENHDKWKNLMKDKKNIIVVHKGNVNPWIMASNIVIHNGCTTAIESYLLGTPAITYMPIKSKEFDVYLPNQISKIALSKTEALEQIKIYLENGFTGYYSENKTNKDLLLDKHIESLTDQYAAEKIINIIAKELEEHNLQYSDETSLNAKLFKKSSLLTAIKKNLIKLVFSSTGNRSYSYINQKYPKVTYEEIERKITKFQQITEDFKYIKIKKIDDSCFMIFKN